MPFRLCLALALLLAASPAQAWWNKDWPYRMRVVADAGPKGAGIAGPIGRTQILVRLFAGNFDFAAVKEGGADLRFVDADDRTPLHYHIERFTLAPDQTALVWVDIPNLAPGGTTAFYIYWGNPAANDGGDARATYDPDTLLVYHFTEENGLAKDATAFASHAQIAGRRDESGLIGFALRPDRPVRITRTPSLAIPAGQAMTWSMWVQPDPETRTAVLFSDRDGAGAITIGLEQGVPYAQIDAAGGSRRVAAPAALPATGWHHIAVTAGGQLALYVDGQAAGEVAVALPAIDGQPVLAGAEAASAPRYAGLIDEFQIARTARPAGALQVAVASQGPDARLLTFDSPEQASATGGSYIGVIVRSVTVDAWVVIGLLAVMSLATWVVMAAKVLHLNRLDRADRLFRSRYRRLLRDAGGDPMPALAGLTGDAAPALRHSALARLARIGIEELQQRLQSGRLQPGGMLPPQSLAAIHAAMESGLTREAQLLSRLMVVLVVSISGGPFLGLLGTVVGVMITFAAIAQAGDVNINAIAPGISAALLATVAGLFVAIPAMFGYNYLLLRIKDANTAMHAFVNETVTRMGEAGAATGSATNETK
jgi:biopolymer transport protein ExbB